MTWGEEKELKAGDKVMVVKYHTELDLGSEEEKYEQEQLCIYKDRPATVLHWTYDDGCDYMPSANTYKDLLKKIKGKYGGAIYMTLQFDDNQERCASSTFTLEKI